MTTPPTPDVRRRGRSAPFLRDRRGVSLVEVLIAMAILGVIGIAVVSAIGSSAREVQTTSEYSLSLFLSQKVAEELIQSTHENPHAQESLLALAGTRLPVRDGLNPWYGALEDTRKPWGRLDPGIDLAVEPAEPTLYRLYQPFGMTIAVEDRTVDNAPNGSVPIRQVEVRYDWEGLKDAVREFRFPVLLPLAADMAERTPDPVLDAPGLDQAIRAGLYPSESGDLGAVVAKVNGNLAVVRDLGRLVEVTRWAEEQTERLLDDIATTGGMLPESDPTRPDDPEVRIRLARLHERVAALQWQTLIYLGGPARRIGGSFKAADLGKKDRFAPTYIAGRLTEAAWMLSEFERHALFALHHCVLARSILGPTAVRAYRLIALERKILELAKLRVLAAGSLDTSYLLEWIDHLLDGYKGRNRLVVDFLSRERPRCQSLEALQVANPLVVERIAAASVAVTDLEQLETRVAKELF